MTRGKLCRERGVRNIGMLFPNYSHIHGLVADAAFSETGAFRVLPPIPGALLIEQLRHTVLDYLVDDEAITENFASKLLAWEHSGFSVDNKVRVGADEPEGRRQLVSSPVK